MSERDDLQEQAYHQPALFDITPEERLMWQLSSEERNAIGRAFDETILQKEADNIHSAEQGFDYLLLLQHKIESVWDRQVDPDDPEAVSKYIREVVLCAEDELHEVLAEVHWKPWKDKRGIKDVAKYREEMADVLHFILDLYLAAGISGREIVVDYLSKHYENLERNKSAEYKDS